MSSTLLTPGGGWAPTPGVSAGRRRRNAVGSRGFQGIGLKEVPPDPFTPYVER